MSRRPPTVEELRIFVQVREFLRWHDPVDEELSDSDQLIREGTYSTLFGDISSWESYIEGYFHAARALLEGPPDKFFLLVAIYPVLFLYRHYIELKIKGLMMDASRLLDQTHPNFSSDHDIISLWNKLNKMLSQRKHVSLPNAGRIELLLKEIHSIDPRSLDTRYALKKDLETPSIANPIEIDVVNLRETMDKLRNELSTLDMIVEDSHEETDLSSGRPLPS